MAADDVEGNQKESCLVPYSCWKALPPDLSYLIKGTSSPSPFPLIVIVIIIVLKVGKNKPMYNRNVVLTLYLSDLITWSKAFVYAACFNFFPY